MGRTDARGAVDGSLEEAISRAKAYRAAGVDVIYAEALQSREEIRTFRQAIPDLLFRATEGAIKPPLTRKEKEELGLGRSAIQGTFNPAGQKNVSPPVSPLP